MDDDKVPTYDVMFQPTIDALRMIGGEASNEQIYDYVVRNLELPPHVAQRPHSGRSELTEIEYRLMWSRTYLRKFGLIDSPRRGWWTLTEIGRNVNTVDRREIVRAIRGQAQAERQDANQQAPLFQAESPSSHDVNEQPSTPGLRSPTPLFPTYSNARHFLRILGQISASQYFSMASAIWEQRGNPQDQVDWSQPEEWISSRLQGADRELASRIWRLSHYQLNPRYTRGCWYFVSKHGLLARFHDDVLRVTDRGRSFLDETDGPVVAAIDEYEGLFTIMRLIAEQGTARRSTLLPGYGDYSRVHTTFQSENVLKSSLYDRLRNLIDRSLVMARGHTYQMTDSGLVYLGHHVILPPKQAPDEVPQSHKNAELLRLASELRKEARTELHNYLFEMDPIKFEELIRLLLEEMGYYEVATTSPTNDKGVDVLGSIKLGISAVREVVQVKRHRSAIGRRVLDELRGSLHRFDAVRGTIISTGNFSRGAKEAAFERGAAPITLIDGETLLDFLIEYEIGVYKRQVDYHEFAPETLVQFETDGD